MTTLLFEFCSFYGIDYNKYTIEAFKTIFSFHDISIDNFSTSQVIRLLKNIFEYKDICDESPLREKEILLLKLLLAENILKTLLFSNVIDSNKDENFIDDYLTKIVSCPRHKTKTGEILFS